MQKFFTTIFLLFYLVSSMGVASVQHYCSMMQQVMDDAETECCCAQAAMQCDVSQPAEKSCCAENQSEQNVEPSLVFSNVHINCCETHHSFKQIETIPLSENISADSDVAAHESDILKIVELELFITFDTTISLSDPSIHLNLPLLI